MSAIKICLMSVASLAALTACATAQNNPHYKHSTVTSQTGQSGYQQASYPQMQSTDPNAPIVYQSSRVISQPSPYVQSASYSASGSVAQSNAAYQECLAREQNYKVGAGVIAGAAGAYAGRQLGGDDNKTLGMVAGTALGGAVGYGAGDAMVDCHASMNSQAAPIRQAQASQPASMTYAPAQTYTAASQTQFEEPIMVETGGQNYSSYSYNSSGQITGHLPAPLANTVAVQPYASQPQSYQMQAATPLYASSTLQSDSRTYIVQEGDTAWNLSRRSCATT